MVGADAFCGQFQRGAVGGVHLCHGLRHLVRADAQGVRCQRDAVEPFGQRDHGGVAACAHIGDDLGHDGVHVRAVLALGVQQGGELRLEIRVAVVKKLGHGHFSVPGGT